jgi:hypothetical protein
MAEVPKALEDCLRQSMQWQWKSMMGLGVGVVYLTAPQAHEPSIMMLMFVYKKLKDEARFSWRGDVAPRESYPTTSWGIPRSLVSPCVMQTTASSDTMLVLIFERSLDGIEGSTSTALGLIMAPMTQIPDETYWVVLHTPGARAESE